MGRIVNGASIVEPAIRPASGSNNDLAPGRPLEIIPLRQIGCGCSSVVEHLLAKEDVASSSLVTRSSLRLAAWRRAKDWSECAVALAEADRPKAAKLRPAGQP